MSKPASIIIFLLFIRIIGFSQSCLPEGITFNSQADIDNFHNNYPNCSKIEGDVEIMGNDITNLNGLSNLTSFGGNIIIKHDSSLNSLVGLHNVRCIKGDIIIFYNPLLTNLIGLGNLDTIGGNLDIQYNQKLTNFIGLNKLKSLGGYLSLWVNDSLTSLKGLENLPVIGKDLIIISNNALQDLAGLDNVTSIGESVSIFSNTSLKNFKGLDKLAAIGGSIMLQHNSSLTSLINLSHLNSFHGTLWFYHNVAMIDLTGLENLTTVVGIYIDQQESMKNLKGLDNLITNSGYLTVINNNELTSLTGLDNLTVIGNEEDSLAGISCVANAKLASIASLSHVTSIWGPLEIRENFSLPVLKGLENIMPNSIKHLTITNNTFLPTCAVKSICQYIANPSGTIEIHDNASGCNSLNEVEEDCKHIGIEAMNFEPELTIFPNPAKDVLYLSLRNDIAINDLVIYNLIGKKLIHLNPVHQPIDISAFIKGIYFIEVTSNNLRICKKLLIK
jgi:hypothetical protein